jgi:hypothetical protein
LEMSPKFIISTCDRREVAVRGTETTRCFPLGGAGSATKKVLSEFASFPET